MDFLTPRSNSAVTGGFEAGSWITVLLLSVWEERRWGVAIVILVVIMIVILFGLLTFTSLRSIHR